MAKDNKSSSTGGMLELMAAAEKRTGLPTGILRGIIQQETGGNTKYFDKYHYPKGADGGRRTTGGVQSSAFGAFGILDSTGAKPGYGVAPMKDKSMGEQIRFASDYAAARIKEAGGNVIKGLDNYGSGVGSNYGNSVLAKMGNRQIAPSVLSMPDAQVLAMARPPITTQPMRTAAVAPQIIAPTTPPINQQAALTPTVTAPVSAPAVPAPVSWAELGSALRNGEVTPDDLNFGTQQIGVGVSPRTQRIGDFTQGGDTASATAILERFGLGRYAQGIEQYRSTLPDLSRSPDEVMI